MRHTMPRTPFSTPFSTSKKIVETRIRSIIAGPQKRPPLPVLALVLTFCFFSVNLVSCQPAQPEENPDAVPDEEAALRMAEQIPDYFLEWPQVQVLFSSTQGDKRLILFEETSQSHAGGFRNLIAGVWDDTAREVSGEVYISRGDDGLWTSWTEGDNLYLLLANNAVFQGIESGSPPVWLRFAGGVLEHPPCILPDAARTAVPDLPDDAVFFDPADSANYWFDHKAIPMEGGLELYTAREDWTPMGEPQDRWLFTGFIPLSDKEPMLLGSASLDGLALNGRPMNDAVTVSSYWSETENPDGTYTYAGRVAVEVRLDGTETLTWELEDELGYLPRIFAARLKDPDRDAIVLELDVFGSQYDRAEYYVLEVVDGALTEALYPFDYVTRAYLEGAKITDLDHNLLQAIRLPTLVDNDHGPEWYIVEWNGADWNLNPDGYFTDYFDLYVPGHEFTLALRGRIIQPGEPYYPGGPRNPYDWSEPVYDDLIQLYDNGLASYAFTSESFTPDPNRPFDGFRWEYKPDAVQIRDINFDGADDFGILCDTTHNDTHCWFVWDEDGSAFRYFASLGSLDVDRETQQLIETLWNDDAGNTYKNIYELNNEGGLRLVETKN